MLEAGAAAGALPGEESTRAGANAPSGSDGREETGARPVTSRAARALVEAMFPASRRLPAGDPDAILGQVAAWGERFGALRWAHRALLGVVDLRSLAGTGRRFASHPPARREQLLDGWARSTVTGHLLQALTIQLKAAYLLRPEIQEPIGSAYGLASPGKNEPGRWKQRLVDAADVDEDLELEADVVVIGSGAGGAVAAYELARRGHAVAIVEAGGHFERADFDGKLIESYVKLYRAHGLTSAVGNGFFGIPTGKTVGGTTTINSGTCYRTPDSVLAAWRREGLEELTPDELRPYLDGVEATLRVKAGEPAHVGPLEQVIERGAQAMGLEKAHRAPRNAPDCDGQGLCQFGCPTDAKRSTNVSYVPMALEAGAQLFARFRADELLRDGDRVRGLRASGIAPGRDPGARAPRLTIRAPRVIVSTGTLETPLFLGECGVRNPHLGRHLTIHPTCLVTGLFDDLDFRNERVIPQAMTVADLHGEGLMFEGGTLPALIYGMSSRTAGPSFVELVERYQQTAFFGFMVQDRGSGRVHRRITPELPLVTYRMGRDDFRTYLRGIDVLGRLLLRAGARAITVASCHDQRLLRDERELERFLARRLHPRDFFITAYHPLGTARLGAGPDRGVCDSDHRVFGMEGLYVMDGSNVPSSLGVNPQITIMSLAARAATRLADELDAAA